MNKRQITAKVSAILACAIAAPAMASTLAQIEAATPSSGTANASLTSNGVITDIMSQGGGLVLDGYTYNNWAFLVNDGTGSMEVFASPSSSNVESTTSPGNYTPTLGDGINLTGLTTFFDNIPELEGSSTTPLALTKVSSGNSVPGPITTTIPNIFAGEGTNIHDFTTQEYLLTLNNVQLTGATTFATHANTTLTATDALGNGITVFQWASSYSQAAQFGGQAVPTGYQNITGIIDFFSPSPEFIPFSIVPSSNPPPPPTPNSSTLFVEPQAQQNSNITVTSTKAISAKVGTAVNLGSDGLNGDAAANNVVVMLKGGTATTTVVLGASSSTSTDTTTYLPSGLLAHGGHGGTNNPIPAGQTDIATVGYNATDAKTPGATLLAGTTGTGDESSQFINQNNTSDAPINVVLNAVKVLELRNLDAGVSTTGKNAGSILSGKAGTVTGIALDSTSNTDSNGDYSSGALTNVTLLANSTSTPYTQYDPITDQTVATFSAVAPNYDQVFGGPNQGSTKAFNNVGTSTAPLPGTTVESGTVTLNVAVAAGASGTYGDNHNVGTTNYTANYTAFTGSADGVVGMGIGDNPSIDVYAAYTAFQPALVTGNSSPVGNGGTLTLTNAATSDVNGLRDEAWITSTASNQDGWSQNNFTSATTPGSGGQDSPGTVLSGTQNNYGDQTVSPQSTTLTYNPASALAGSYSGGSFIVGVENGQVDNLVNSGAPIQGATHNDLAPVAIPLANETGTGTGSGTYNFGGGTFIASGVTNLTGSFTQTGGLASFNQITGSGAVTITGGTAKLLPGGGVSNLSALSISGTGLLDITNNALQISGGNITALTSLIASAYAGGTWTGTTGITSSSIASQPGTTIGIASIAGAAVIKYTWYGDFDLNGKVTGDDLAAMNAGNGLSWATGDLNFDGVKNADDWSLFQLGDAEYTAHSGLIGAAVPEPATLSLIALPLVMGLRRRRR